MERLLLVMLPVWKQGIDDNYLRREGYAAMEQARTALIAAATPRGIPLIDVGRWQEAWRAHQRKVKAQGWNEPCVPGCTSDIADYYVRLSPTAAPPSRKVAP